MRVFFSSPRTQQQAEHLVGNPVKQLAYRPKEAAAALGVSTRTLRRWRAAGKIRQCHGLISAKEIEQFLRVADWKELDNRASLSLGITPTHR